MLSERFAHLTLLRQSLWLLAYIQLFGGSSVGKSELGDAKARFLSRANEKSELGDAKAGFLSRANGKSELGDA